jgi:hypothetical protein
MVDSLHVYRCNGFEPMCAASAPEAALEFAKAKAVEIYGVNGHVDHISLEEFSPDRRIQRYEANVCRQGECRRIWLCVTRMGRSAEGFR